ncbi:MAG: hypothetical protein ACREL7_19245 [Longimicrobiales bacterium]
MTFDQSPWHPDNEVERLLCSLAGVVSARVVANPLGKLEEIHILASPLLNPKQIVRNVGSALSAGLGIVVDRRIISVAQIRHDAAEADMEPVFDAEAGDSATDSQAPPADPRLVYVGYDAQSHSFTDTECHVTVRRGSDTFTGTGTGDATTLGRIRAGARATFSAISAALESDAVGLEGATLIETHGETFVLVAARGLAGRSRFHLTGVAPLGHAPEEAAILASLQATNRWIGFDA